MFLACCTHCDMSLIYWVNFDLPSSFQPILGLFIELLLWTGIKKGPPRKLKFPDNTDLIEEVKKKL